MKAKIKIFISEIEGVWTDGSFFINGSGNEYWKFNFNDLTGINLLKKNKIPFLLISGEESEAEKKGIAKFGIKSYKTGIKNKEKFLNGYLKKKKISWSEVAYIGSTIDDLNILKKAGLSATPITSPFYVRNVANWILRAKAGEGAFSQFVEDYLEEIGKLKESF